MTAITASVVQFINFLSIGITKLLIGTNAVQNAAFSRLRELCNSLSDDIAAVIAVIAVLTPRKAFVIIEKTKTFFAIDNKRPPNFSNAADAADVAV